MFILAHKEGKILQQCGDGFMRSLVERRLTEIDRIDEYILHIGARLAVGCLAKLTSN